MTVTVRVPATSANLGPGFDSLGLALSLHDTVTAGAGPDGVHVRVTGAGSETAGTGEQHLVVRALRTGLAQLGVRGPAGITLTCVNAIPQGFGLGSSAGAIVAGLLAARALTGTDELSDDTVLQLATRMEGHPDNVAACLYGGLTIAWTSGSARVARLVPLPGIEAVVCTPATPLPTVTARSVLPGQVPHADAAANSARAALLVAALTSRPDLLLDATRDYLHQDYRAGAMPATAALIARLRAEGVPAVVSGAGPSVLAFTGAGSGPDRAAITAIAAADETGWQVRALTVDTAGATVG